MQKRTVTACSGAYIHLHLIHAILDSAQCALHTLPERLSRSPAHTLAQQSLRMHFTSAHAFASRASDSLPLALALHPVARKVADAVRVCGIAPARPVRHAQDVRPVCARPLARSHTASRSRALTSHNAAAARPHAPSRAHQARQRQPTRTALQLAQVGLQSAMCMYGAPELQPSLHWLRCIRAR